MSSKRSTGSSYTAASSLERRTDMRIAAIYDIHGNLPALYDREQAAARVLATDYPQAADFAANNILQPPSEAEALAVFTA